MDLNRLPKALRMYLKNKDLNSIVGRVRTKPGGKDVLSSALIHMLARLSSTGSVLNVTLAGDLWTASPDDTTFRFEDGAWSRSGRAVTPEVLLESIERAVHKDRAKRIDISVDVSETIDGAVFQETMEALDDLKAELGMRYSPTDDNASKYRTPYDDIHTSLGIVLSFEEGQTEDFLFHVVPCSSG